MDPHAWAPYAPYILFAVAAASLFWLGSALARRRTSRSLARGSVSLMEASQAVYDAARRERLVIVSVAEKSPAGPLDWFARSIASVVPVYRVSGASARERYAASAGIGPDLQSLYIERRDIRTYLRWARTVQ